MHRSPLARVLVLNAIALLACAAPIDDGEEGDAAESDSAVAYEGDEADECSDGADNDRDADFECEDAGCAGSPDCEGVTDADADGYAVESGDCDDADPAVSPAAPELCNGLDDDCDGEEDEDAVDADTWYADRDGDGYGDASDAVSACEAPAVFYLMDAGDCDDDASTTHPDANESCNGVDDDCDGEVDEDAADAETWYADEDGDGYGDPDAARADCDAPTGYVDDITDCDDSDPRVSPGASEVCNDVDDDCDGETDEDWVDGYEDNDTSWGYDLGDSEGGSPWSAGVAELAGLTIHASDDEDWFTWTVDDQWYDNVTVSVDVEGLDPAGQWVVELWSVDTGTLIDSGSGSGPLSLTYVGDELADDEDEWAVRVYAATWPTDACDADYTLTVGC